MAFVLAYDVFSSKHCGVENSPPARLFLFFSGNVGRHKFGQALHHHPRLPKPQQPENLFPSVVPSFNPKVKLRLR